MTGRMATHRGVRITQRRICDVLCVESKARWWFIEDDEGRPEGSHFKTLGEAKRYIDTHPEPENER